MPISAQEAMDKVFSLELRGSEVTWYENLCTYTDYHINKNFDGVHVMIPFERMFIPNPKNPQCELNCSQYPHSIPQWRQKIVIKVWQNTYKKLGWNITLMDNSKMYKFEPNLRQLKLERILE